LKPGQAVTYSLAAAQADLVGVFAGPLAGGIAFAVTARECGEVVAVKPQRSRLHNIANALAALCAAKTCGVALADATAYLSEFSGSRRRLEVVGTGMRSRVIDDFLPTPRQDIGHAGNHARVSRTLLLCSTHAMARFRLMKDALVDCFRLGCRTTMFWSCPSRYISAAPSTAASAAGEIVAEIERRGRNAQAFPIAALAATAGQGWPAG